MNKLKVFLSDSFNPHLNLATEEWIFHNLDPSSQVLFLWRNEETVVIGRNQNPWSECNLANMKDAKVHLARRTTGGGAVYHDLQNTNFTFLSPREAYKKENNIQIILNGLKKFGVFGEASGRNDLVVPSEDGPRKFSGSAYREKKDRAFHHGTLLINTDMSKLGNYLTPNPKKLQAKGKESVRARVVNLSELATGISHDVLIPEIIKSFEEFYGEKSEIINLTMESLEKIPELKNQYENLSSWEWLYGSTLEFTHKMDNYVTLGFFDLHFVVEDAVIKDLKIYTDCLYPQLTEELSTYLKGKPYKQQTIEAAFAELAPKFPDLSEGLTELKTWIIQNLEV